MAQIEIMQSDLPHTLYNQTTKKNSDGNKPAKINPKDKAFKLQEEANRRAAERRAAKARGEAPLTMNEIFKK